MSSSRFCLAAAALLACAALPGCRGLIPQSSSNSAPILLAAAPFANLTGAADWDWASRALPAAVLRQAIGLPDARVLTADSASQALASGATHLLLGYFTPASGGVTVHYRLVAAPDKTLARASFQIPSGEPAAAARSLAAAVRQALRPGGNLLALDVASADAFRLLGEAFNEAAPPARAARLRAAVDAEPRCAWCWEELAAHTARHLGRDAALALLEESRQTAGPLAGLAAGRLALLAATLNNDPAARLQALESLLKLTPADPAVLIPLAESLVNAHRFGEGVDLYERAYRAEPSRADLLNSAGYALAWAGRYDDALAALARYEKADPDSANPADSRGEVLMMAGRFTEAEQAFLASYERDPRFNSGAALEKAALVRWLAGDAKAAGAHLERFLKQRADERDPLTPLRRARWQYRFGQASEAIANLKLLAARPGAPAASLAASSLALYSLHAGRAEEALQFAALARQGARDSLSLFAANAASLLAAPEPPPAASGAGRAFWAALRHTLRHELPAAEAAWRDALKSAPPAEAALARELLAQVLLARGDAKQAAALVRQGWPLLSPDQALLFDFLVYPDLLAVRGAAAAEANQNDEARRLYEQFLHFAGSRPDPLGLALRARSAVRL